MAKIPPYEQLIARSGKIYQALTEWSSDLGPTNKATADAYAPRLLELNTLLENLHSTDKAIVNAAKKEVHAKWKSMPSEASLAYMQETVAGSLLDVITVAEKSDAYKTIRSAIGRTTETLEESSNLGAFTEKFGNVFERHSKWMEGASPTKRVGVGVGYIALGSIVTNIGGHWLSQSLDGRKRQNIKVHDEMGQQSTLTIMKPIPAAERLLKGALGTGGVAIGIAGTGIGLYNILSPRG